jgi:hypothetical protein
MDAQGRPQDAIHGRPAAGRSRVPFIYIVVFLLAGLAYHLIAGHARRAEAGLDAEIETARSEQERLGPILELNAALQSERNVLRMAIEITTCFHEKSLQEQGAGAGAAASQGGEGAQP